MREVNAPVWISTPTATLQAQATPSHVAAGVSASHTGGALQRRFGLPYLQFVRPQNHPWVQPRGSLGADVEWNLWTRQPPFNHLETGDAVWIAFGDTRVGPSQIEWEPEITKVVTAYYQDLRHAWRKIAEQFPVSQCPAVEGMTWRRFSDQDSPRSTGRRMAACVQLRACTARWYSAARSAQISTEWLAAARPSQ